MGNKRKRRTTTIKNEEKNKLGEDITQMKVAAVDKNMTLVATFIIIIMIIIKLFCVLCKSNHSYISSLACIFFLYPLLTFGFLGKTP